MSASSIAPGPTPQETSSGPFFCTSKGCDLVHDLQFTYRIDSDSKFVTEVKNFFTAVKAKQIIDPGARPLAEFEETINYS
jgi:hypothetical protein